MNRLPPELWSGICDCLALPDIANFRLSCRFFGSIGAPFVVRKVTIRMETDVFDRFRALANDPVLSGHVRSLLYTPNVYCLAGPDVPHDGRQHSKLDAKYKVICEDQIRIQDSDLESVLFLEALPKLTGLQRVVIRSDGWPQRALCKKPRRYPEGDWRNPLRISHRIGGVPGSRALASILKGLEGCDPKLRKVKAGRLHWRSIGDLPRTRPQLDLFSNLISLTLQFCICHLADPANWRPHPDHDEYCQLREDGVLPSFLATLSGIETLTIAFCSRKTVFKYALTSRFVPWLEDVVHPGHRWPRLNALALRGINLTRAVLLDFLERHSDTLHRFELFAATLDAKWATTMPEIRAILPVKDAMGWCCLNEGASLIDSYTDDPSEIEEDPRFEEHLTHGGVCPVTDSYSVAGYNLSSLPASAKFISRK